MRTITSDISTKWINRLIEIEIALIDARYRVGVTSPQWTQLYQAYLDAKSIRDQLLMHTTADVSVEAKEMVNV